MTFDIHDNIEVSNKKTSTENKNNGCEGTINNIKESTNKTLEGINIQGSILEKSKLEPGFNRIYLLRHLPILEDTDYILYEKLKESKKKHGVLPNEEFAETEEIFQELGKNIKVNIDIFVKNQDEHKDHVINKVLTLNSNGNIYGDKSEKNNKRVPHTLGGIEEHVNRCINAIDMPGSNKCILRGQSSNKTAGELNKVVEKLLLLNDGNDHVIISNRSYANAFSREKDNIDISIDESERLFEQKGYDFLDFSDGKPLVNNETYLKVDIDNFQEYLTIFVNDEEFKNEFSVNDNKSILRLQNSVNEFFSENIGNKSTNDFLKNILFNNTMVNHDLHIFCIANLLKDEESNKEVLQIFIKTILNYNKSNKQIFDIFNLFKNTLLGIDLGLLMEEHNISTNNLNIKKLYEVQCKINSNANNILVNSVDNNLSTNIIFRDLYYYSKRLAKEYEDRKQFEIEMLDKNIDLYEMIGDGGIPDRNHEIIKINNHYKALLNESTRSFQMSVDINTILDDEKRVHIILSNVGEGKSVELFKMKKVLDEEGIYLSLFYSAKDISGGRDFEDIKKVILNDIDICKCSDKNIILFFDGIDELNNLYKEQLKIFFTKDILSYYTNLNIILASRKSEFDECGNTLYDTIGFKDLSDDEIDNYLKTNLYNCKNPEEKLKEIYDFMNLNILDNELKNTPLILYFLVKIAINGNLSNVKNRSSLYEEVVYLILSEHQSIKLLELNDGDYDLLFDTLGFCSYNLSNNNGISKEDIESYWLDNRKLYRSNRKQEYLDQIFILYKMNDGNYSFILHSFQEFFLARYLANCDFKNTLKDLRNINNNNWNNWRNIKNIVPMFEEILLNNGEEEYLLKLNFFLEEIIEEDDIYGEGFFIGLGILYRLEKKYIGNSIVKKMKNKYVNYIINCKGKDILNMLTLFDKFQKKINYSNNIYLEEFSKKVLSEDYSIRDLIKLGDNNSISILNVKIKNNENSFLIYKLMIESGRKYFVEIGLEGIDLYFDEGNYDFFTELLNSLINLNDNKYIESINKLTEKLIFIKEFSRAYDIFLMLCKMDDNELYGLGMNGIGKLIEIDRDLNKNRLSEFNFKYPFDIDDTIISDKYNLNIVFDILIDIVDKDFEFLLLKYEKLDIYGKKVLIDLGIKKIIALKENSTEYGLLLSSLALYYGDYDFVVNIYKELINIGSIGIKYMIINQIYDNGLNYEFIEKLQIINLKITKEIYNFN